MSNLIDRAIVFAVNAHSGTMRKSSNIPYILHPVEAAAIVSSMTDDCEVIAASVLHDVLEDTDATTDEIENEFGPRIASLVKAESEDKRHDMPSSDTWKLRKQETIDFLNASDSTAIKMIALSDKLSNTRCMYIEYQKVGDELWNRFNEKSKAEHEWYHKSILKATSELSEFFAWQEYAKLIEKLFED